MATPQDNLFTNLMGLPPLPVVPSVKKKRTKSLQNKDRYAIAQMIELEMKKNNGKKPIGLRHDLATHFHVSSRTIDRIIKLWKEGGANGTKSQYQKSGRRTKYPDFIEKFRELPLKLRRTVRLAAASLKIPKSIVQRRLETGELI